MKFTSLSTLQTSMGILKIYQRKLLKAIDKLPSFQGNNVVSARDHWNTFMSMIIKYHIGHLDVLMKFFVLSLEEDAIDWLTSFLDNSISTKDQLEVPSLKKWGERRDNRYLLVALSSGKRNENETIEEFNKRFNQIVQRLHTDMKTSQRQPSLYITLMHLMESLAFR
jgi:hypothetical protein